MTEHPQLYQEVWSRNQSPDWTFPNQYPGNGTYDFKK